MKKSAKLFDDIIFPAVQLQICWHRFLFLQNFILSYYCIT